MLAAILLAIILRVDSFLFISNSIGIQVAVFLSIQKSEAT